MTSIQADTKIIGLIDELFQFPERFFQNYFIDKKLNYKGILRIHLMMWMIAPAAKLIHNLFSYLLGFIFHGSFSGQFFDGFLKTLLIYPMVFLFIYQLDKLRYYYQTKADKKRETFNPKKALVISFLPFSSSAVFWFLPAPFNLFLIIVSLVYSLYLTNMMLRKFLHFDKERVIQLTLVLAIYTLSVGAVLTFILNVVRTIIS